MNINFSGPINFTGMGIVSLNLFKGLVNKRHEVALWALPTAQNIQAHPDNHALIRVGINKQVEWYKNSVSLRHWHPFDLAQHVGKGPHVGSTVFELDAFTKQELNSLNNQDGIVVPTKWGQQILTSNGVDLPICVVPHGVDRTIFNEEVKPALPDISKNNETVFVNVGKIEIRKSHDILIEAFNKAFEPSDNVRLLVHFYNPFYSEAENKEWFGLYKNSKMGSRIGIVEGRLETQQDVAALMASADCMVLPARSEGFGLEGIEAMSVGLNLITTDYAGHTEYCNDGNAHLIIVDELEPAFDGRWFNGEVGNWAKFGDSQMDQLVYYMRKLHTMKQQGELKRNEAGIETAKQFSWEAGASKLVNFLETF